MLHDASRSISVGRVLDLGSKGRQIIAECRSKVLQNALSEHSAILSTFIKLPFVLKIFVLSILSGRFTQVLLYHFK